jgi:hypothetical protein
LVVLYVNKTVTESYRDFPPANHSDEADPIIDELTVVGPRPADLPAPACPLRAAAGPVPDARR